jgi:hypothetical protein
MKRPGCLFGAICCITSPILFFVGTVASDPSSIFGGPRDMTIYWLFTGLSIALFIIGIVFAFIGLIRKKREIKEGNDDSRW